MITLILYMQLDLAQDIYICMNSLASFVMALIRNT